MNVTKAGKKSTRIRTSTALFPIESSHCLSKSAVKIANKYSNSNGKYGVANEIINRGLATEKFVAYHHYDNIDDVNYGSIFTLASHNLIIHSMQKNYKTSDVSDRLEIRDTQDYLNFTLFTFNKIRILIQYLVAKIGLVISWIR
ncbi:unnamed protein product [Rhizophagus irregularis]|nr:unnamed protein product [Rhizophagus irregularis]